MFFGSSSFAEIISHLQPRETVPSPAKNHYPYHLEKKLQQAIQSGDLGEVDRVIERLQTYPPPDLCKNNPKRSRKNSIICNCTLLTRNALEAGVPEDIAYGLSDLYINKVEEIEDLAVLNKLNMNIFYDFLYQIKKVLSESCIYSPTMKRVIRMLDEHYCENISLSHVAETIGISRSYLSRLFKEQTGTTFTEYLHRHRMEKAKKLLFMNSHSLAEVALELGYSSQSHFNKTFKQYTGQSPLNFKRMYNPG